MTSIRLFLTLTLIAIIVLVSFLSSLRGYRESMLEAERLFDLQLLEHSKLLSLLNPHSYAPGSTQVFEELVFPHPADIDLSAEVRIAYQIFDPDELLVLRSADAPTRRMSPLETGYRDVNFSGYRWRALVVQESVEGYWILAAQRLDVRYELAENVILEAVIPTLLSIPLAGMLIWVIVGYGLRPIRLLAQEVQAREATDLSPVRIEEMPRELTPLTQSTNDLLHRLQLSFDREKRFAADAAHELRTPISTLKVQVHNLLNEGENPGDIVEDLRRGVDHMGHLVEQILVLNRMSPDQYMVQFLPVDLHRLAKEVVSTEFEPFLEKEQHFELAGGPAVINGDAMALRSLLQNLLSNASKYTPRGEHIRMQVVAKKEGVCLRIEDSGPGIPETYRKRVFDRFYRLDGDRHASGVSGSGLGLAIVKHIAQMHGTEVELSTSEKYGGLSVSILFSSLVSVVSSTEAGI